MSTSRSAVLEARLAALEAENKVLKAASEVKAVAQEKEKTIEFLDMRKEQIIQVTDDRDGTVVGQIRINQIVKWSKDERGVPAGSWLRIDLEKPRGEVVDGKKSMIPVFP